MHSYLLIGVMALTTIIIRFLPFILFKNRTPEFIIYLGKTLPYCAMAMLVVFCYRNMEFTNATNWLPGLVSGLIVVLLYKWKHNTSIAIVAGTILYMLLVQNIFR